MPKEQHAYLNEQEVALLEKFISDPVLFQAVKKVILEGVYFNGVLKAGKSADPKVNAAYYLAAKDPSISNEKVGELVKAQWQAINFLEVGFEKLSKFQAKEEKEPEKKVNKAR